MTREFQKKPTLRTARITYLLALGKAFTTDEVADLLGITNEGARVMMQIISSSHHVPVTQIDGKWTITKVTLPQKE